MWSRFVALAIPHFLLSCRFQGVDPLLAPQARRRVRVVTCKRCGALGHMQKTCRRVAVAAAAAPTTPGNRVVMQAPERTPTAIIGNDEDSSIDGNSEDGDQEQPVDGIQEELFDQFDDEDEVADVAAAPVAGPIQERATWVVERITVWVGRQTRAGAILFDADPMIPPFTAAPHRPRRAGRRPLEYLWLFWNMYIINTFITATNNFAADSERVRWFPVTTEEFYIFLAMIIWFGINRLPDRAMAWASGRNPFSNIFISTCMSRHRFNDIMSCWHWQNNFNMTDEERRQRNRANGFWSVQQFIDALDESFLREHRPQQFICIDEQCIACKSRHRCKCYNPHKPEKWHFKVFCLNDSITGYVISFYLYQGRDELRPAGMPATQFPTQRLLQDDRWHDKGYILFQDNWFSSYEVARLCAQRKISYIATFRVNRKGDCPPQYIFPKTGPNKRPRGTISCVSNSDVNGDKVYVTAWMDKKPVHMVSNIRPYVTNVRRNSYNRAQEFEEINIVAPSVITIYNKYMGGTDKVDQALSYYRMKTKTKRWQAKIYVHFLFVSLVNAHVLFRADLPNSPEAPAKQQRGYYLIDFLLMVIEELLPPDLFARATAPPRTTPAPTPGTPEPRTVIHTPIQRYSENQGDNRGHCKICKRKSVWRCNECNVTLCLIAHGDDNCWKLHHVAM